MMATKYSDRLNGVTVHRLWDLRAAGVSVEEIGPQIGWNEATIRRHLHEHGGVRPRWGRDLKGRSLTRFEREEIMVMIAAKAGVREIARTIGRHPSTVSRELARHTRNGRYRATAASAQAWDNARRPKQAKLVSNPALRERVQADLMKHRSPEQISGRLKVEFPDQAEMQVSHETIYQSVYLLSRGGLKRELVTALRTGRGLRRAKRSPLERRGKLKDMVLIADRPVEAADRSVRGHWEGDLIMGTQNKTAIGTVVERRSGTLILVHIPTGVDRLTAVRDGLTKSLGALPDRLRRTLTWDQGKEMGLHKQTQIAADIDIYFCDPHTPWQRPTNENTNGLLRQYFPKGTDLSVYSAADLQAVAAEMNDRPRKRLGYHTPNEMLGEQLLQ